MSEPTYIGDSVYVREVYGMIELTTNNGLGASNTIFLEQEVWHNLNRWVQQKMMAPKPE